ncbi:MAG: hypothetical protein K0B10_04520 [Vicingaceae bacterium]|nr:hypothetical protein [Vicingaceae bacterium]
MKVVVVEAFSQSLLKPFNPPGFDDVSLVTESTAPDESLQVHVEVLLHEAQIDNTIANPIIVLNFFIYCFYIFLIFT